MGGLTIEVVGQKPVVDAELQPLEFQVLSDKHLGLVEDLRTSLSHEQAFVKPEPLSKIPVEHKRANFSHEQSWDAGAVRVGWAAVSDDLHDESRVPTLLKVFPKQNGLGVL